jgi:uncharacterized membrane protein
MTWLILIVLAGFVFQQHRRLRNVEERFADFEASRTYHPLPAWPEAEPEAPMPAAETAPAPTPDPAIEPEPELAAATLLYAEPRPAGPVSEPVEELDQENAQPERRSWKAGIGFEELFGRRLPIWAGGITLAVAGMLIVKLSIESGLLSPPIRVILGLVFGAALIGGAETALRFEERVRDSRVRQALAGAGIASLYASILVAVNLYHLINPLTAMLGMAAVTALALFLAIRFGPPSALLGLAGGLAAPALVGSASPNVPLLSVYLALAVSGLCTLSRNQRWAWLGISALIGGFGWGIILLIGGVLDTPSSISLGLYLLLLGVGIPALGFAGDRKAQLQLVSGIVAAAQMAALVATGGFALTNWGLFALLSVAIVWLANREAVLARLPAIGLVVALLLMGAWTNPSSRDFTLVMAGFALIYGGPAVRRLWRPEGGIVEAAEIGAIGLGGLLIPMFHFHHYDGSNDLFFGTLGAALGVGVGACAAVGWNRAERRDDARFALLAIVATILFAGAALLVLPAWQAGLAIGLLGLGLLHLGQVAEDKRLEPAAWIFAAGGVLTYPLSQLLDWRGPADVVDAVNWGGQAAIMAAFAWRARFGFGRIVAEFVTPLLLYIGAAALVPELYRPLIAPVLLAATAAFARGIDRRLIPAMIASLAIIVGWALAPAGMWLTVGVDSLAGTPEFVTALPTVGEAIRQLLIPGAAALAAGLIAPRLSRLERNVCWALASALSIVGVHCLYKHVFAIATPAAFVGLGLAERTVWELGLAGLALIAFRLGRPVPALVFAIATAAHETIYTLLIYNPLWAAQSVGPWPVINLLLPVYLLAIGLAVAGKREVKPISSEVALGLDVVTMGLVVLFAFSELRQLFHGTLLNAPGVPVAEEILRSILAIALAIGFLLWGIRSQQRAWRIASLALMLGAVGKVFLFDASGLQGVTRIASFVALGLSLIGIGWLYSRHLGSDKAAEPA